MLRIIDQPEDLAKSGARRCVLLLCGDAGRDSEFVSRLEAMDLTVDPARDALLAFARALLNERLDETRTSWGLRPAGPTAIAVAEPDSCAELDRLSESMELHLQEAFLFLPSDSQDDDDEGGSRPPNDEAVRSDRHGSSANPGQSTAGHESHAEESRDHHADDDAGERPRPHPFRSTERRHEAPVLRYIAQPEVDRSDDEAERGEEDAADSRRALVETYDESEADSDSLITAEELAMLLGRDDASADAGEEGRS